MKIDVTVITALIAAIAAIIAPCITTVINNRYQYKMQKLNLMKKRKVDAIQSYVSSCSNYIAAYDIPTRDAYFRSYGEIFLYTDKRHWEKIEAIHKCIENENFQAALCKLSEVCQALSVDINI